MAGKRRKEDEIIEAGSEITGAAAGAAVGLILGGPPGAIAGAALAPAISKPLRWAAAEWAGRLVSRREEVRVGAALQWAVEMIEQRRSQGHNLRNDGFFNQSRNDRSEAEKITEGVLLAAQRQWEEKKVRHLGYALGNLAFEGGVDALTAGHVIALGERLSWRQYVLISLIFKKEELPLPDGEVGNFNRPDWSAWGAHRELAELRYKEELVSSPPRLEGLGQIPVPGNNMKDFELRPGGQLLAHLMRLDLVNSEDRERVVRELTPTPTV